VREHVCNRTDRWSLTDILFQLWSLESHQVQLCRRKLLEVVTRFTGSVANESACSKTVYNAIKTGYRLFDGACDYGNEKEAGEGVRRAITDGLVKREDLCKLQINPLACRLIFLRST
jgi:hypothetical protein